MLNTALGKMTLLPLVKVNSPGQSQPTVDLTRRVGPPTRRVPILTSQPFLAATRRVWHQLNEFPFESKTSGNLHPTRRVV